MDIEELLRKAKEEHGGIIAFTGGALLGLMITRRQKAHGIIWWLLIGVPGLAILVSVGLMVGLIWAIVVGVQRLQTASTAGRQPRYDAELQARQDGARGDQEQIVGATSERPDQNGVALTKALEVPTDANEPDSTSIEERLRRLDAMHEQGLINKDDFEARKKAIISEL